VSLARRALNGLNERMTGSSPGTRFLPYESSSREAARWIARLERGLREEEGALLKEWLKVPRNRDSILEIGRLWHGPEVNSILTMLIPPGTGREPGTPQQKPKPVTLTALFTFVLAVGLFAMLFMHRGQANGYDAIRNVYRSGNSEIYVTQVGETRDLTLADGSHVALNTGTRITVTYDKDSREIELLRGEASFDVAQSMGRPFYVNAGRRRFEGAGTRFNLRVVTPEDVELMVTDGNVRILRAPPRQPESMARRRDPITYGEATVKPFEEARVAPGYQSVTHIEPSVVGSRLAWRHGLIICDGQSLEDALAEVERYTNAKFVLADATLRNIRVSGSFRTGNINAVRLALRRNFEVNSRKDADGRIVLIPPHS
jgi:transmembrane sensor